MGDGKKKIIFVKWFPDDYITGCELLTWQTELVYSRIIQRIYNTRNNLYDEENTWNILIQKIEKYADIEKIKEELLKKDKIYLEDDKIKNKGCDKYLKEALDYLEDQRKKGKKGADKRWGDGTANGTANGTAIANHKPQATNHKPLNYKTIMETWNRIVPTSHIQQMNDTRKKLFQSRFKPFFKESYEEWEKFLNRISKISFLWGSNDRQWKADFNWVLNENNLLKILEGKYETETKNTSTFSSDRHYDSRLKMFSEGKVTNFMKVFANQHEGEVREMVQKGDLTKERATELGIKIG